MPINSGIFWPPRARNRFSQIFPKSGRILKYKPENFENSLKSLFKAKNEGRFVFCLWPEFYHFASKICAFTLKNCQN